MRYWILTLLFIFIQPPALAATQDLETLRQMTRAFILEKTTVPANAKLKITIERLDPRLRLASCPKNSLSLYFPNGHQALGATTVGVQCTAQKPWSIFIPAKVNVTVKVMTATGPLLPGTKIGPEHLHPRDFTITRLKRGYFPDGGQLLNQEVKRPLRAGQVITPYDIRKPVVVNRGQSVAILATINGVQVSMQGTALEDGYRGQLIRVRNTTSKRVIEAQVLSAKRVEIRL
jgi:flagellar basal body P-ring formation protein FlgA